MGHNKVLFLAPKGPKGHTNNGKGERWRELRDEDLNCFSSAIGRKMMYIAYSS